MSSIPNIDLPRKVEYWLIWARLWLDRLAQKPISSWGFKGVGTVSMIGMLRGNKMPAQMCLIGPLTKYKIGRGGVIWCDERGMLRCSSEKWAVCHKCSLLAENAANHKNALFVQRIVWILGISTQITFLEWWIMSQTPKTALCCICSINTALFRDLHIFLVPEREMSGLPQMQHITFI